VLTEIYVIKYLSPMYRFCNVQFIRT